MGFFRRFRASGFQLTAIAAVLVVVTAVLAKPWAAYVRLGHYRSGSIVATIVGSVVIAAALLDRWRPMRWFVRLTSFFGALTYGGLALTGYRPKLPYAVVAGLCAAVCVILGSRPVRRWFDTPANEWGSAAEEVPAAAPPATLLPPETVERVVARATPQRPTAGSELRDARSSRSPGERK